MDKNQMLPQLSGWSAIACVEGLRKSNDMSARFGLSLSEPQMRALARRRQEALLDSGRGELGEGILPRLIEAFCDSPYLCQANWEESLGDLQELFYYFKNESRDRLSDDELIASMKRLFDGPARGATEYLAGLPVEAFTDPDWGEELLWNED